MSGLEEHYSPERLLGRDTEATVEAWDQIKETIPTAPRLFNGPLPRKSPDLARFRNPRFRNQWIGNCVGQATASVAETTVRTPPAIGEDTQPLPARDFSPLWSYWGARQISRRRGIRLRGDGAILAHSFEALQEFGVIDWEEWPSTEELEKAFRDSKLPAGVERAERYKPVGSLAMLTSFDQILEYLAAGYSVALASPWFSGARTDKDNYFSWRYAPLAGGHAYEGLRYDLDDDIFEIGNSWALAGWGDEAGCGWTRLSAMAKTFSEVNMNSGRCEAFVISEVEGGNFPIKNTELGDYLI